MVLAAVSDPAGEVRRQLLGLRLARTLLDLGLLEPGGGELEWLAPVDDPRGAQRFGWPFTSRPDEIYLKWPNPGPSRTPSNETRLVLSPWALHSLMLGDWAEAAFDRQAFRIPTACALLICDGVTEEPVGHDLLRVTSRLEVLELPSQLYSHALVCGLTDGCGSQEAELQITDSAEAEIGFSIRPTTLMERTIPTFVVVSLDNFAIPKPDVYTFRLRVLDHTLAEVPLEVHGPDAPLPPEGIDGRQLWTWDAEVYFGERH